MKFHSMKRSLALAGAICLAVTSSVLANPAAPTGLQAPQLSTTEDGATLIWERPSKTKDIYSYHVYMDGKLIANTVEDFSSEAKKEIQDFYAKSPKAVRVIALDGTALTAGISYENGTITLQWTRAASDTYQASGVTIILPTP